MTILLSLFIENIEIYLSKFNVKYMLQARLSLIISRTNDKTMPKNETKKAIFILTEAAFENSRRFHALKDFSAAYWGIISFL